MSQFENLRVWQQARIVVREVGAIAAGMRDQAGLGSQMRRAAISVASNIAEGAGRRHDRDRRRFLDIARASADEVRAQLALALDAGCIGQDEYARVQVEVVSVGKMLTRFIQYLDEP
ncbi:MAG: four helix bundle protein [Planctomycetes bacterium]|nr:four helix bundle protein [Planctomycetota bacterium]